MKIYQNGTSANTIGRNFTANRTFGLSDLFRNLGRCPQVFFGVDLGNVGAGVAEDYLGCFETELGSDFGRGQMPELVWCPFPDTSFLAGFVNSFAVCKTGPGKSLAASKAGAFEFIVQIGAQNFLSLWANKDHSLAIVVFHLVAGRAVLPDRS